jgi:PPM family protein phosphatase
MLDVEFILLSDDGKIRDHNEDYLGHVAPESPHEARSHGWLFALADGVGGHDHGEVASQTAVTKIQECFKKAPMSEPLSALLGRLAKEANVEVYETAKRTGPGGSSMATTLVACALRYDRVAIAHAGDSRCYLVRDRRATLLTKDHTVTHGVLSRSLGTDLYTTAELSEHQIHPGDVLVLCSDGLHNSVEGSEIAAVAGSGAGLDHAARRLIELANDRDGSDNISVLLVRVREVERVGMYRGRPYQLR